MKFYVRIKRMLQLTAQQKLNAMSDKFYHGVVWDVKAGDYYTTSRSDLELYKVVKIEDGEVFTEYCTEPGKLTAWNFATFTTEGFGVHRVYVDPVYLPDELTQS